MQGAALGKAMQLGTTPEKGQKKTISKSERKPLAGFLVETLDRINCGWKIRADCSPPIIEDQAATASRKLFWQERTHQQSLALALSSIGVKVYRRGLAGREDRFLIMIS